MAPIRYLTLVTPVAKNIVHPTVGNISTESLITNVPSQLICGLHNTMQLTSTTRMLRLIHRICIPVFGCESHRFESPWDSPLPADPTDPAGSDRLILLERPRRSATIMQVKLTHREKSRADHVHVCLEKLPQKWPTCQTNSADDFGKTFHRYSGFYY